MVDKVGVVAMMAVIAVAVLMAEQPLMAEAVTCDTMELSPCFGAFIFNLPPSASCCAKLREQQPCFCQYYNNPAFAQYVNSTGAQRIASSCQVSVNC